MSNEQIEIIDDVLIEDGAIVRDPNGRFPKGVSGNPLGRELGSKNRATVLRESMDVALLDQLVDGNEFIKVLEAVLLKAKQGDIQAAKLILKDIAALREDSKKGGGPLELAN